MMKKILRYFTPVEWTLWIGSMILITGTFLWFDRSEYLTPAASLLGVTSLIFNAKGHPAGQVMMLIFSVLYSIISYSFSYFGEMVTYLGMTAPMALWALIAWLRHPFRGNRAEVKVGKLSRKEIVLLLPLAGVVTAVFYGILSALHTTNLLPSTFSITTSFLAAYLTARRSPFFALAYALNDVVLILLWSMASRTDRAYLSVVVCFLLFLVNDLYGFYNWCRMKSRQKAVEVEENE